MDHQGNLDVLTLFQQIVEDSVDTRQQGTRWEYAVKYFLENDPAWTERIAKVWLWDDAPTNTGIQDIGIDLVAQEHDGSYWAIQAKCYSKNTLAYGDVSTFFSSALFDSSYSHYMVADTVDHWSGNLQKLVDKYKEDHEIVRLDLDTISSSNLDWIGFANGTASLENRITFDPRDHQKKAIDRITTAFESNDRTTVVMACGTGKTLMALRFVEGFCPSGTVLFLAPSISLVSQTMRSWVNQTRNRINIYVVCSDGKASKVASEDYGILTDVPFPATTNALTVAQRFAPKADALNVIFSTYQSIEVIHEAQKLGLPAFDLIICDEAHRTTGRLEKDESAFVKVHDNDYINSAKRLYMTATPRVYTAREKDTAPASSSADTIVAASMDDTSIYGPICYTLSFGEAVQKNLLTDYKLVVLKINEASMPQTLQLMVANEAYEIEMPNAAKFIGLWKALYDRKHASDINDLLGLDSDDTQDAKDKEDDAKRVLHHAIAFAANIKASKQLTQEFQAVIDAYIKGVEEEDADDEQTMAELEAERMVKIEVQHVDGTMDSPTRKSRLDWLAEEVGENECHILTNARCLAEGIDVPVLDAVIYLSSRKSKVDIIQSVGRVMRKAEGKKYGYIIIPVFVAAGVDPGEALRKSPEFKTIYDVVAALRSHDERLEAMINAAELGDLDSLKRVIQIEEVDIERLKRRKQKRKQKPRVGASEDDLELETEEYGEEDYEQPELGFNEDEESFARDVTAEIVRRCGTRIYWSEWSADVGKITQGRADQIAQLVETHPTAREAFLSFLGGLRDSLNDSQSERDAIDILAQHEVTRPIFQSLFKNEEVLANNPINKGLDRVLSALYEAGLPASIDNPELVDLYNSVKICVSQVTSDEAKQNLIKEIYNDFFKAAFTKTAEKLGIVYTPVECVDAQLHMVQRALKREFNANLGDRGVHILDGFAGTGTYMCRLIEDKSLISDEDLPYKYEHDLHSNEIVPLAATIMDINIEQSYHKRMGGEYKVFPGALLTDTFQMHEDGDTLDDSIFTENSERIENQKSTAIQIVIGNPPWSAGQDNANDNAANESYPTLDARIADTYVAKSSGTRLSSLYDSYIRAFRWASDRITQNGNDRGIVSFITNGGWLRSDAGAGVRRTMVEEFNSIYVFDLRGNARTQGEERRKEKDNVFGQGTRTPVTITMLVKNPDSEEHGVIRYHDIGDYLTQSEKLNIVSEVAENGDPDWEILEMDRYGDWLDQREDESWYKFAPMGVEKMKAPFGIFMNWSLGVATNRDTWVTNYCAKAVENNMTRTVEFYNAELDRWTSSAPGCAPKDFVTYDSTKMSWTRLSLGNLKKGLRAHLTDGIIRPIMYRPFCRQNIYWSKMFNEVQYQLPKLFPTPDTYNLVIDVSDRSPFITDTLPDLELVHHGQCFPLYYYETTETGGLLDEPAKITRHDAITDQTLDVFRKVYPHIYAAGKTPRTIEQAREHGLTDKQAREERGEVAKVDIFYYIYGILHSPEYRKRFKDNLSKELPRIPFAADFKRFAQAGRDLAKLHLSYEDGPMYPLTEVDGDGRPVLPGIDPGRVEKLSWGKGKDKTRIVYNPDLTLTGIPDDAHRYVVNGKTGLEWLIDRYKVSKDNKSGIVNDPNEYSDDPRYIVDLIKRVTYVSVETMKIVDSLPPLKEITPPEGVMPFEWTVEG